MEPRGKQNRPPPPVRRLELVSTMRPLIFPARRSHNPSTASSRKPPLIDWRIASDRRNNRRYPNVLPPNRTRVGCAFGEETGGVFGMAGFALTGVGGFDGFSSVGTGTHTGFPHSGHSTVIPAPARSTIRCAPHLSQANLMSMVSVSETMVAPSGNLASTAPARPSRPRAVRRWRGRHNNFHTALTRVVW